MEEILYQKSYEDYRKELGNELAKTAESFVRIGYLLKVARDTDILRESGYQSVTDFARAEFGIDKTQVSRFMNINDKFAENGYSESLKPEYRGFGFAKLAIMLMLPDAINEGLSPAYSKAEIQSIKDELDEEYKISDIETLIELPAVELPKDNIQKVIYQLAEDQPELYVEVAKILYGDASAEEKIEAVKLAMVPQGEKTYSVRVPGTGRLMLMLTDAGDGRLVNTRTGEKEDAKWTFLAAAWNELLDYNMTPEEKWSQLYCKSFPKAEVAPVQPAPAPMPKKESKVSKAPEKKKETKKPQNEPPKQILLHDVEESIPEPLPEEIQPEEMPENVDFTECDEDLEGQMTVEDYPELMPEENLEVEKTENADKDKVGEVFEEAEPAAVFTPYQHAMIKRAQKLIQNIQEENWKQARMDVEMLQEDLQRMMNVEEMMEDEEE